MWRAEIPFHEFDLDVIRAWDQRWFLLTAGRHGPGQFNTMTVSWGSFGVIWGKPFAQVFVRPSRYTHQFMEGSDDFTLSAFGPQHRAALDLLGSRSGREMDKIAQAGLTPIASTLVAAPAFEQADLIVECRKIYHDVFRPSNFLADYIEPNYKGTNYHDIYFGEIVAIRGVEQYRRRAAGPES